MNGLNLDKLLVITNDGAVHEPVDIKGSLNSLSGSAYSLGIFMFKKEIAEKISE